MIFEHLLDYIASIFCLIWTYTGKHIFSLVFKHKIYEDKTKYHWWWWNLIDYYLLIFSWLIVGYYSISFIECRPRFIESSVHSQSTLSTSNSLYHNSRLYSTGYLSPFILSSTTNSDKHIPSHPIIRSTINPSNTSLSSYWTCLIFTNISIFLMIYAVVQWWFTRWYI